MTKEVLTLALEALKLSDTVFYPQTKIAIAAIERTLAQPEQEPVAFINVEKRSLEWVKPISWHTPTTVNLPNIPLYTTPPQRTWVGLTDREFEEVTHGMEDLEDCWIAIEAKLRDKNNA